VYLHVPSGRWHALLRVEQPGGGLQQHRCGVHATEVAAARTYNKAALRLLGHRARLNELAPPLAAPAKPSYPPVELQG
jgi:hypothetical protein